MTPVGGPPVGNTTSTTVPLKLESSRSSAATSRIGAREVGSAARIGAATAHRINRDSASKRWRGMTALSRQAFNTTQARGDAQLAVEQVSAD
ncbi:hypothetical protein [Ottowia sp.]|uniref:hypothetical protein n=1 Tax=Ottowia sp. TaxID=1898956 RepID=UPI0025D5E41E|nr:hypothetical protein [Ottowia sp.]